jgi:hypothetical protein
MSGFRPEYLVLHDYGGTPKGDAPFNPYHTLVAGGRKIHRDPANPYGAPAPHAFKLNPRSIGLSWGGPVGGTPDETDLKMLREEVEAIKRQYPDIKILSHGEAYAQTKGTPQQASKAGRGLEEAAWRRFLDGTGPMPASAQTVASGPPPVSARGITAGHPNATPAAPMPFSLAAPVTGADPAVTPAAAPAAVAGINLPFGLSLGKASADLPDPLAGAQMDMPRPLANMQRKPVDMTSLMQLAATKRRGVIG